MTRKERKFLGRFTGEGRVYKDNQQVANVQYHYDLYQDFIIAPSLGRPPERIPGLIDYRNGSLLVTTGGLDLKTGETVELELKDGNRLKVYLSDSTTPYPDTRVFDWFCTA